MKSLKIAQIAPLGTQHRNGTNDKWPIRLADGRTPAQVRAHYQRKELA